ncbi:hypothetical protein B6S12_07645 [Helicobacter valdiviensis]|uniref:Uncharacterized protein n=1 Tax=Helicobacter valdiviensis TaxID=1458358 RepID=A0A2W6NK09_9HELI|nr:hypothetical protein [Helicobacter valdiviensis]PZT47726.1 hypothetical protein B6S12_07645 [Helicobacter valdiviensis]
MHIDDFATNLKKIQDSIFGSEFSRHLKIYNFDAQTLSGIMVQILQVSMQGALSLKEQEFKEREISLGEEKLRQELEITTNASKITNKINLAEALKSLIQAESMLKSVNDNATINKANAYVGMLNVVGNAEQSAAIAPHTPNVVKVIDDIVTKDLKLYEPLLSSLADEIKKNIQINEDAKEVFIFCPKLTLIPKERVRILGFSTYSNNEVKFVIGDKEIQARTYDFYSEVEGTFLVKFCAKNQEGSWVEDKITIEVKES